MTSSKKTTTKVSKAEEKLLDEETYSLDQTLAKYILPRLKRFKKLNNGYPNGFTWKSWNNTLSKMIYAMDYCAKGKQYTRFDEEEWKKANEGLQFFGAYFINLWW